MRITAADHINIRIKDVEATLAFYQGVLGLEPDRLDDYREGKRPLFAFRVNESFIIHVFPDPELERGPGGGYDHLALTVAFVVVGIELVAIAYIRYRYFSMNFFMSVVQVVVGGILVFASGVLIGSRG